VSPDSSPTEDLAVKEHFASRARSYNSMGLWVRDPSVMALTLDFIAPRSGHRFLDVGAGTGAVLQNLLTVCPEAGSCLAIDTSEEMISQISDERINRCCGDAQSIPCSDSTIDVALCRQVLHYVDDLDRCVSEISRVLDSTGAIVIGQITPFCEEDECHWKRILTLRQPLRKHLLTLEDLVSLLLRNSFSIVRCTQIRAKESLASWLSRYSDSQQQCEGVRALHLSAPDEYKRIHAFHHTEEDDIVFDNCWTFIRAVKPSYFSESDR